MGFIQIKVNGSFNTASRKGNNLAGHEQTAGFSAQKHGHAHAVQEAIAYLTNTVLPAAINLDHELHDDGDKPSEGFQK